MISPSLPLENGLLSFPKTQPIVIQVQELPLASPSQEIDTAATCGFVDLVGKAANGPVRSPRTWLHGLKPERPHSSNEKLLFTASPTRARRRSSVGSADCIGGEKYDISLHKRPSMQLPSFQNLNTAALSEKAYSGRLPAAAPTLPQYEEQPVFSPPSDLFPSRSWPLTSQLDESSFHYPYGVRPLLTPPEDLDSFKWDSPVQTDALEGIRTVSGAESRHSRNGQTHEHPRPSPATRPSEIQMPAPSDMASDDSNISNWLGRACQHLVSSFGDSGNQTHIQMVVQALPSQAKDTRTKPVFEKVVEVLQSHFTLPPYITITHAVSQVISMDEVPASPPATPNTHYSSDDYFQDQTIFTHAAVVPAYHALTQASAIISPRPSSIIAAPSSIQLTTLERYIPPTSAQEVADFFSLSRKSYLADRLLELSANNGTLLLVYPTRSGAQTFANKYIGPVIEPFLRQFVLLNNLFVNVAVDLGHMASLPGMKEFALLKESVLQLCQALGQRAPTRGSQSQYQLIHAETAEVVLERTVWKEWFLDQEQPRLRQNLVDYHKAGGRMPSRVGHIETTPGMLAREVVDGIRSSREPAGNVGIEVGVFVIRRSVV